DRTSIGLVLPAKLYKESGKRPEELYLEALASDPIVSRLTRNGRREGNLAATKDWSFVADRLAGENWFLVGESAGFADPILSAGLSLTMVGARELAYTVCTLARGKEDAVWLKESYENLQQARIRQHIRFADFWYAGNGQFT